MVITSNLLDTSSKVNTNKTEAESQGQDLDKGVVPSLTRNITSRTELETKADISTPENSITLHNKQTGENCSFIQDNESRRLYKFKLRCKALDKLAQENNLTRYFLTLTLSSDNHQAITAEISRALKAVTNRFLRAGLQFKYCWVVELQKKRYAETGEYALHWHVAIIAPVGSLPDCYYSYEFPHYRVNTEGSIITSSDMTKLWGLGQHLCCKAKGKTYAYLAKYMVKELSEGVQWSKKSKRFSSSQMSWRAYPQWATIPIENAIDDGLDIDSHKVVKHGGLVLVLKARTDIDYSTLAEITAFSSTVTRSRYIEALRYRTILEIKTPWEIVSKGQYKSESPHS